MLRASAVHPALVLGPRSDAVALRHGGGRGRRNWLGSGGSPGEALSSGRAARASAPHVAPQGDRGQAGGIGSHSSGAGPDRGTARQPHRRTLPAAGGAQRRQGVGDATPAPPFPGPASRRLPPSSPENLPPRPPLPPQR